MCGPSSAAVDSLLQQQILPPALVSFLLDGVAHAPYCGRLEGRGPGATDSAVTVAVRAM